MKNQKNIIFPGVPIKQMYKTIPDRKFAKKDLIMKS